LAAISDCVLLLRLAARSKSNVARTPEKDPSAKASLKDDVLFGAQAIADELGLELRKTFYLLERGYLPATKCGAMWTTTRSRLRRFFDGVGL
jgi:hypothetical protein